MFLKKEVIITTFRNSRKIKCQFCYINPYRQQYKIVDNNLYSYSPSPCPPMRTNDFKLKN